MSTNHAPRPSGPSSISDRNIEPPVFWWLFFPPIMIAVSLTLRVINPEFYFAYIEGELGLVENATVLLLFPAVIFGLLALYQTRKLKHPLLAGWIVLNTIGCFYFMGEEASWGQHWFGWAADGVFADHPRGETNLHNTNHWFDQRPKVLVEIWTIIGAIIVPIWAWLSGKNKNASSRTFWYWIWPTYVCLPAAVIGFSIKSIERVRQSLDLTLPAPFDIRFSEPQEYYFGLFFFLYMYSLLKRIKAARDLS